MFHIVPSVHGLMELVPCHQLSPPVSTQGPTPPVWALLGEWKRWCVFESDRYGIKRQLYHCLCDLTKGTQHFCASASLSFDGDHTETSQGCGGVFQTQFGAPPFQFWRHSSFNLFAYVTRCLAQGRWHLKCLCFCFLPTLSYVQDRPKARHV